MELKYVLGTCAPNLLNPSRKLATDFYSISANTIRKRSMKIYRKEYAIQHGILHKMYIRTAYRYWGTYRADK